MCEIIVPALSELLLALAASEKNAHEDFAAMEAEKAALGLQPHEAHPKFFEFWNGYRETLGKLLKPVCSEKFLKRGYGAHCGDPPKFGYINGECKIIYTMKTSKKAVVETEFISGTLTMKHQFTMKLCDDRWIVDDLKYGFADSTGWNSDSI